MKKMPMCNTISYLMVQICKAHRNKANELLGMHELHAGQELMLEHVSQQEGITLNELTTEMGVSAVTTTRMVGRLEKNGFLEKVKCSEDQRAIRVYLTDKGKETACEIAKRTWGELEEQMTANLSTEEKVLLKRLLMQVLENFS
ncbi:MarR family transcriptional regulator [Chitinophaga pendula]|uniref:MarR family winged helix-turn-helix transcriptional regulator n=1 Tax=Chitinophaga TaxID=79328 RepID=UPI000BAE736C|nr:MULTISPECIES: MarR family transcriptional regulator [Chitinophaga]ASZ13935.1 transcriptional regulator [Chitinophaga sp. MD30]UCJ08445.1 MarR family transcriptional regulator [Chitinophaga pendula]